MEKSQFIFTHDNIFELLGPMNTDGFIRLQELVADKKDSGYSGFIESLAAFIDNHIA